MARVSPIQSKSPSPVPIPAPNLPFGLDEVVIDHNNALANLDYGKMTGYRDMARFIRKCCISKAFTKSPPFLCKGYLQELWYTAYYDEADQCIRYTVENGARVGYIKKEYFIKVCGLRYLNRGETPAPVPTPAQYKQFLIDIGYATTDGKIKSPIQKNGLTPTWRLLASHIIQSLGGSVGSKDQLNGMQCQIMYGLALGKRINFGELLFEDLVARVKKTTNRERKVPYVRYLSLILEDGMGSQYGEDGGAKLKVPKIGKIFQHPARDDEVALTTWMQQVINFNGEQPEVPTDPEVGGSAARRVTSEPLSVVTPGARPKQGTRTSKVTKARAKPSSSRPRPTSPAVAGSVLPKTQLPDQSLQSQTLESSWSEDARNLNQPPVISTQVTGSIKEVQQAATAPSVGSGGEDQGHPRPIRESAHESVCTQPSLTPPLTQSSIERSDPVGENQPIGDLSHSGSQDGADKTQLVLEEPTTSPKDPQEAAPYSLGVSQGQTNSFFAELLHRSPSLSDLDLDLNEVSIYTDEVLSENEDEDDAELVVTPKSPYISPPIPAESVPGTPCPPAPASGPSEVALLTDLIRQVLVNQETMQQQLNALTPPLTTDQIRVEIRDEVTRCFSRIKEEFQEIYDKLYATAELVSRFSSNLVVLPQHIDNLVTELNDFSSKMTEFASKPFSVEIPEELRQFQDFPNIVNQLNESVHKGVAEMHSFALQPAFQTNAELLASRIDDMSKLFFVLASIPLNISQLKAEVLDFKSVIPLHQAAILQKLESMSSQTSAVLNYLKVHLPPQWETLKQVVDEVVPDFAAAMGNAAEGENRDQEGAETKAAEQRPEPADKSLAIVQTQARTLHAVPLSAIAAGADISAEEDTSLKTADAETGIEEDTSLKTAEAEQEADASLSAKITELSNILNESRVLPIQGELGTAEPEMSLDQEVPLTAAMVERAKGKAKAIEEEPPVKPKKKKIKAPQYEESPFVGSSNQPIQPMIYEDEEGTHVISAEELKEMAKLEQQREADRMALAVFTEAEVQAQAKSLAVIEARNIQSKTRLWNQYREKKDDSKRILPSKIVKCVVTSVSAGGFSLKMERDGLPGHEKYENARIGDFAYSEWIEMHQILKTHKGSKAALVVKELEKRMKWMEDIEKKLDIDIQTPLDQQDPVNDPPEVKASRKRKRVEASLGSFGKNYSVPASFTREDFVDGKVFTEPELGMLYLNHLGNWHFLRASDIPNISNVNLIVLRELFYRYHPDKSMGSAEIDLLSAVNMEMGMREMDEEALGIGRPVTKRTRFTIDDFL